MTAQQFFVSHLLANAILYSKSLGQLYCYPAPDKAAAGLILYVFGITQFCQVYAIATYVEKTWIYAEHTWIEEYKILGLEFYVI